MRDELRATGTFTAEAVAVRAACSPATFYSHFGSKDDAVAAAFDLVLHELVAQSAELLTIDRFVSLGVAKAVSELVERQAEFFRTETLVFRHALARLPDHRSVRHAYRDAESITLGQLGDLVDAGQRAGLVRTGPVEVMAESVLVLSQSINNPRVLRPGADALRAELAVAITAVLAPQTGSPT